MSVTLTKYPVTISSGKVRNIFAGFNPVELEFKREDIAIVDVSQGVDNKILISITGDITASLNIGEYIYLYSVGTSYIYDGSFQILDLTYSSPNTEITVEGDFIEVSSGGYCNYKQNWYLEAKLVNPDNNDIRVYPQLLQNDGNPNGLVEINTSMLVDFLKNEIKETSQQIYNARKSCKVMYREVYREDDNDIFTLVNQTPIIIIFAADEVEIEDFICGFDIPRLFAGYPFWLNLLHSPFNYSGFRVKMLFDELDINENSITTNNLMKYFNASDFGILQSNFNDNTKVIEQNTKFIRFGANSSGSADYATGDYNDTDYLTINTP
jgi:hypothetical protein